MLEAVPWGNPTYGILGRAAGNVAYGGTVNPPRNRKGGAGNPPPTGARASALPDIPGGGPGENERYAGRNRVLNVLDRILPFDLPQWRMDDEKLFAGNGSGKQDSHTLTVLAAAVIDRDEGATLDQVLALGGDVEFLAAAARRDVAHASRPSWSMRTMSSVIETKRG